MTHAWLRASRALLLALGVLGWALPSAAHKASDAYLQLEVGPSRLELRWDIALRDLDAVVDLDRDGDRALTWGEVRAAQPAILAAALPHLGLAGCEWTRGAPALESRSDGVYAVLNLTGEGCSHTRDTPWRYTLFADSDPTHRGIAQIRHADGSREVRLLDPLAPPAPGAAAPHSFVRAGFEHILGGYDHIMFLLCLLLPAVLRRDAQGRWQPVTGWREALLPVAGIVTLFTLAHSVTLALAALRIVVVPSALVEPAIAATIMLAALDNIRGVFGRSRALVTFVFGLIHGFGFAGALAELDLPAAQFAWALLRFNVGLEIGQLACLLLAAPLLMALRARPAYPAWVLRGGSTFAGLIALVWLSERVALV